ARWLGRRALSSVALHRSGQIEDQDLGRLDTLEPQGPGFADGRAVARFEQLTVDLHATARDLNPRVAALADHVLGPVPDPGQARVEPGVGVDPQGAVAALGIDDEPEPGLALVLAKRALLVARRQAATLGHDPDLQEVRGRLLA